MLFMKDVNKRIEEIGFLPVIKLDHPERDAKKLAHALCDGGIPAAEVTFRAAGADKAIALMLEARPDMLVGAGTVLTVEQAKAAIDAGASFLVSPGFDEDVVKYALDRGVAIYPGTVTPSEVMAAIKIGLSVVKFFPAEQYGGLNTIGALSGPFPQVRFVPTGGVNLKNLGQYIKSPAVVACGGSYMIKAEFLDNDRFDEITRLSEETRRVIDQAREPQAV